LLLSHLIIGERMIDTLMTEREQLFIVRDRVRAMNSDETTLNFSSSLASLCDFGTASTVHRMHFFLDFIFH
jgi:hypothetical protein